MIRLVVVVPLALLVAGLSCARPERTPIVTLGPSPAASPTSAPTATSGLTDSAILSPMLAPTATPTPTLVLRRILVQLQRR